LPQAGDDKAWKSPPHLPQSDDLTSVQSYHHHCSKKTRLRGTPCSAYVPTVGTSLLEATSRVHQRPLTPPRPSQVVPPEFVTLFFSGKYPIFLVNFDRILTESVNKLT
jgi:hypothetical protein